MTKLLIVLAAFLAGFSGAYAAETTALEVQFVSIGTGIDAATKTLIEAKIRDANEENVIAKQTSNGWGLEGEVTICLQFTNTENRNRYLEIFEELAENGNEKIGFDSTQVTEKDMCADD